MNNQLDVNSPFFSKKTNGILSSLEGTPQRNREIKGGFGTFWNAKAPSKFKTMQQDEEVYSEYSSTDETIN